MRSTLILSTLLAGTAFAQAPVYGQCGGSGWTGPTSCVSGACCTYSNEWYSQCIPGSCSGSGGTTTTARTTTTTSRTTTRTTTGGSTQPTQPSSGCGSGSPHAIVTGSGSSYSATRGGSSVYSGNSYLAAINAAVAAISSGQRVSVMASGSIGANTISIGSGKIFEVCGTIDVGNRSGRGAIESTGTTGVSIPYLKMTGNPYFGLLFYGTKDLTLGEITMNLSGGMGIRFHRDEAANTNVKMGTIRVTGAGSHAVETWNINTLTVTQVIAQNVGECGLLLQTVTNARVGYVEGNNVASGNGYATFRMANRNGRLNNAYSTNIYVDKVYSRGGGRGVFCVSESGGVQITTVDLANNGNNAILIENCYGVNIRGGTVNGGGEVRLAARSEFANNRDISITLKVDGTTVRESPCGENVTWNLSGNGARSIC